MENEKEFKALLKHTYRVLNLNYALILITVIGAVYYLINPAFFDLTIKKEMAVAETTTEDRDRIEDGIHLRTGLIDAEGLFIVVNNCTNCHSAKLVTQNRMTAERWNATIEWMQETQNLWDLGENQEVIVNYLVTNYPPKKSTGRRAALTNINWYELED
jgi:hypothetical protein